MVRAGRLFSRCYYFEWPALLNTGHWCLWGSVDGRRVGASQGSRFAGHERRCFVSHEHGNRRAPILRHVVGHTF